MKVGFKGVYITWTCFHDGFVSLFGLLLGVPVNSYGYVGTLPPFFYPTSEYTQNVLEKKNNTQVNQNRLICMGGFT